MFFIRDGIKFPDFIHSQKRLPGTRLRDHDMQWDFWSLSPESAHQVTWLMGDRGLPASWRDMDGFGSHTYQWINAAGERFWVKYHFKTNQGVESCIDADDADSIAGEDADFHIRDLSAAIDRGDFPTWDPLVQVMPYEDAQTYRFNPFDLTKVWPHADYPLIPVGRCSLEPQPGELLRADRAGRLRARRTSCPGIATAPTRCCSARVFTYADAHRYRVGTNHDAAAGQRAARGRCTPTSKDGAMPPPFNAARPGLRAELLGRPGRRPGPRRRGTAGKPTASCRAPPGPCTPRTTTSARPARSTARSSTTPPRGALPRDPLGQARLR